MTKKSRIEFYLDNGGAWRWRLRSSNGRVTASSGESFHSKQNAKRAARRVGLTLVVARELVVQPEAANGVY